MQETADVDTATERLPRGLSREQNEQRSGLLAQPRPDFYALDDLNSATLAKRHGLQRPATINVTRRSRSNQPIFPSLPSKLPDEDMEGVREDDEERTPTGDLFSQHQQVTWYKDVESHHTPVVVPTLRPRPVMPSPQPIMLTPESRPPRHVPPSTFFWASLLVLIMLVLGGVFGIFVTFGHGILNNQISNHEMSLQISPSNLPIGATMTLRGSNFTPHGKVGLTRDTAIPLLDTGGTAIITANAQGTFTDTVVIGSDWEAGQHLVSAEDAARHKIAQFPVFVIGKVQSLRPAHLNITPTTLDMGSGDVATNSTQTLTLTNLGGGQINWHGSTNQTWVQISPNTGSFISNQRTQITVAVNRTGMKTGHYTATISLTSNAGNSTIPIQMQVIPLKPEHEAVLSVSQAVLSFNAVDGGSAPPAQQITISNPGLMPLNWQATTSASWLSFTPQVGNIESGNSQALSVNVNTSSLLPGTYNGVITIAGQGNNPVQDSPQNVYVNVTIMPQCALQVSPGNLTFTGIYQQPAPAAQSITLSPSQGCASVLNWSASSSANWLTLSATSGNTSSSPTISVSTSGLKPGTYNGSVYFSSSAGTQTVPVTFTLGQPTAPLLAATPTALNFNGILGQPNPAAQTLTITNTGGGTLNWQAAGATAVGGNWLTVTPASGSLSLGQSATVNVSATTLNTLVAGTYNATITVSGTDGTGKQVNGSPQTIAVTFVVQSPCTISVPPTALAFTSIVGQATPLASQPLSITASGACANTLNWTATATSASGGNWLAATPATGTATLTTAGNSGIDVTPTGLTAGTYHGTVTFTATDSVTKAQIGTPQQIPVTLTVQPPCTLSAPSATQLTFAAEAGTNPAVQTFTIGATGACTGSIAVTPTVTLQNGTGWLAVTPAAITLTSGKNATVTVTVTTNGLAAGTYTGSISLAATNGGVAITGSPQAVSVTLTVGATPALAVAPGSVTINTTTGQTAMPLTVNNNGGSNMNWTATLATNAPSFVTLSVTQGSNVSGGGNQQLDINVNATGLPGGSSYTTSVTITATDPVTGNAVANSPMTIPITINVAAPAMQLSTTTLSFSATAGGSNPATQDVVVTNTGGDGLKWTTGTPSASWLTVSPTSGSDASGATSNITFTANITGLAAGQYSATVVITPSTGNAMTVTVNLTVS